ncbi:MAG: hypothetical protein HFJ03_07980 [Lachnospira sp.]|nr:hypothetical protein [Lachnospira sp.]
MGNLILCRTKEASNPFHIKEMGVRIYSLEELCYVIYNNIYIINEDFFSDAFIAFIEEETLEKDLADKLRSAKKKGGSLAEMVAIVLLYVDYYTMEEVEAIKETINTLNAQNVRKRLKIIGDNLLNSAHYYNALWNYERIIKLPIDKELPALFYANVYHNMGIAYAKMFMFFQAELFFNKAYDISQYDISKKYAIIVRYLLDENEIIELDDDSKEEYAIKQQIECLKDNARGSEDYKRLQELEKNQNYHKDVSDIIENWKQKYLENTQ